MSDLNRSRTSRCRSSHVSKGVTPNALIDFVEKDGSISFSIYVVPRSSRTEIVGEHDRALKIKLKSPPVDGAANAELVRFLSKLLAVPKTHVEVISGKTSRKKRLRILGVTQDQFLSILQPKI